MAMAKPSTIVCVVMASGVAAACRADEDGDGASASRHARETNAEFSCDPADAHRPDKPREEVAGVSPPPVPRRTCTLPQRGCVTASGDDEVVTPPAPGVDVSRVSKTSIHVAYDLGSNLGECQPTRLRVAVYTTISGLPPFVDDYPVSGPTGRLRLEPRQLPGDVDYGPPDILFVSSATEEGLPGDAASVGLPPPEAEAHLSAAEAGRIKAHREACRADIDDRTSCEMGRLHPVSGPVTAATPAELTRSVRDSLEAHGGFSILHVKCVDGARCEAAFGIGDHRLDMSYGIQALKSVPTCWEVTAFRVTRPVPELGGFAAPLPTQGCVATR